MAGTKWTDEQKRAIDGRNCSLLVAAAAGAGKTAVLVERIIQKITDEKNPVDIDNLLIVTFTNAAASEMRERIGDAISRALEKNPDSLRLQRQIALLNKANITTIHSFCLEVIRGNFHVVDLDPSFRIADDTESVLLKQEAMEEIFDGMYENEDKEFLNLVESYGGSRSDRQLQEMVLKLYEFSQATPSPGMWIGEMTEKFNVEATFNFNSSAWARILMDDIKIEISGLYDKLQRALYMMEGVSCLEKYYSHVEGEVKLMKGLLLSCGSSWDDLCGTVSSFVFESLPRGKKDADKEVTEKVKAVRNEVKDKINKLKKEVLTSTSSQIALQMQKLYPKMQCLGNLVELFSQRYGDKKKEKGVIDFNDIEHYCINILTERDEYGVYKPSKAALSYREKFDEIMIDEYQDSNMVQELILTTISRKDWGRPNIFMVGDVKQSIYRFRQAKPELFLEKYNTYSDGEAENERRILLYKNFRSRKEVIDSVNYIFKGIMSKKVGELDYTDNERLNPGAEFMAPEDNTLCGGPVELHIIETGKVSEDEIVPQDDEEEGEEESFDEALDDADSVQLEARMVANRIKELVHQTGPKKLRVYDKSLNAYRPVEYRDIVILMRATSTPAPVFMEELGNMGIPAYADTGSGYFEAAEVQTIMSLLQIIDNPLQDIPLFAVLRSPIAPFTPEELIDIRMKDGVRPFYEALKTKSAADDETGIKAEAFIEALNKWRDKAVNMSISEFIWYLYNDTGYYAYTGAMPGGVQRQANLRILFERAREYEATSLKGLFNFINFISRLQKSSGDMGSAKILGENENVVRIMSIHKSKGLEFPVTIVCGLGRKFNMRDLSSPVLFHHELGFGPDFVDSTKRYCCQTVIKQALKKKIKLECLSEEMRILYVALTRAKEKLILTGTVNSVDKSCGLWGKVLEGLWIKVPEHQVYSGGSFLDWICPILMKHPDGTSLREGAGVLDYPLENIIDDESRWEIKLWTRKELSTSKVEKLEDEAAAGTEAEEEKDGTGFFEEIKRRLEWEYGYNKSSMLPAKLSVTELKRKFRTALEDEYTKNLFVPPLVKKPAFLEGKGSLSAAEKGTMMHLVMQHISLDKEPTKEDIDTLVERLLSEEFMTEAQASSIDKNKILGFFKSIIGRRLIKSGNAKREVPFFIEIESTEVYRDLGDDKYKDERILLQGIIDCYFEEDDGLVLLDYKTDYVKSGDTDEVKIKYRLQIDYYTRALEKITGKRVKEKYIYLFSSGEVLEF